MASLLFFAQFHFMLVYICICILSWLIVPYPKFRAPNKFIQIKSEEQLDELLKRKVERTPSSKTFHLQYRNKMMYFIEFYADWALTSTFVFLK